MTLVGIGDEVHLPELTKPLKVEFHVVAIHLGSASDLIDERQVAPLIPEGLQKRQDFLASSVTSVRVSHRPTLSQ